MPTLLSNFGLDFLSEDDETMMDFVGYLTREGKSDHGVLWISLTV